MIYSPKYLIKISGLFLLGLLSFQANALTSGTPHIPDSSLFGIGKNMRVILPVAFYQEETSVGLGIMGGFYFTKDRIDNVSSLQGMAIYTLKNQVKVSLLPKIFTTNQKFFITGHFRASHYPDKFYGIGQQTPEEQEENFTFREVSSLTQVQRRILGEDFMAGLQIGVDFGKVYDMQSDGLIYTTNPIGTEPFTKIGIGALATWDTRDNMFAASKGQFAKATILATPKFLGSSLISTRLTTDLRLFTEIYKDHIAAFRFYSDLAWGDIPFQNMPAVGGTDILRGYYQGRYRDKKMITAIAEYRFPIYSRLRGAVFANAADVAPKLSEFNLSTIKYTVGGGMRFRVNPTKVQVRVDVGITTQGRLAFYITANEAF